ncbi:MAG: endonuclease, partial [Alphaproteobacteria bacterium]|nr:endonuclease [Alphaproteobacteria bacterium]
MGGSNPAATSRDGTVALRQYRDHRPGLRRGRDCAEANCIVASIDRFTKVLGDRSSPATQRLEALKFVVHFVGDLHQPFHVADNHDRGGNEIAVTFAGRKTNLHAVWDTALLAPAIRGDERAYALSLARSITAADAEAWKSGSTVDWANDTHAFAVRTVYGALPHARGILPPGYAAEALPLANRQLQKAGVRLAAILNAALR